MASSAGLENAEALDAIEETLEVALPVEPALEGKALLTIGARRDVGPGILAGSSFADGVAVVDLTASQTQRMGRFERDACSQVQRLFGLQGLRARLGMIAAIAAGQIQRPCSGFRLDAGR